MMPAESETYKEVLTTLRESVAVLKAQQTYSSETLGRIEGKIDGFGLAVSANERRLTKLEQCEVSNQKQMGRLWTMFWAQIVATLATSVAVIRGFLTGQL